MAEDRKGKTLQRKRGENEKKCTQINIKEKRIHQTEQPPKLKKVR